MPWQGGAVPANRVAARPRRQRSKDREHPAAAGHLTALMTSLFCTVPVSPWTFAASDSAQFPAIVRLVLKRYTPGSVLGAASTDSVMVGMPSGDMSSRVE